MLPISPQYAPPTHTHVKRECCFCATLSADGRVMLWDARVEKLLKRGGRRADEGEAAWKPMHVVHLLNMQGGRAKADMQYPNMMQQRVWCGV